MWLDRFKILNYIIKFFDNIKKLLSQGQEVKLSGFGNFQLKNKSSRPGRNPRTGEDVEITARRVVTFKSGQRLKKSVKTLTNESD